MRRVSSFVAASLFLACSAVISGDAALGSPNFKPTPERPVGWRGDWTGRYTGATPPMTWSRRVAGITTALRYQAQKPAGEPGKDAKALEYFTIKDWLVAGPFSVEDPKVLDKDFLGGESTVLPNENDKAGDSTWKFLRADIETQSRHDHNEGTCGQSYVDFVYVFGKVTLDAGQVKVDGDFANKAAYAHTYIHSPAEAKVQLQVPFSGAAGRFWLNGKPTDLDKKGAKSFDVTLAKGWNRLLLKVTIDEGLGKNYDGRWLSKWLVAAYFTPMSPITYETKNVTWMTKLTGRSMSQPIIVGDKIFLGSAISDLVCISKKDGKILWMRYNTPYDGLTAEEKAAEPLIKEKVEPLLAKLEPLHAEAITAINAAISSKGLSSAEEAELDKKLKARITAERAVHAAFYAINRKKYPPLYENEVSSSNPTPCSDGTHVYWICGGGMKGPGAYVTMCFDLDGKRIWSRHDSFGAEEHGNHTSPALVDGKLIFAAAKTLYAFDAKTGKEAWRNSPKDWQNGLDSVSPFVVKVGAENAIVAQRFIHRVSDGTVICPSTLDVWGNLTPIVDNGVIYNPVRFRGWKDPASFVAVKVPASSASVSKPETLFDLPGKDVAMPIRMSGAVYTVASPLLADGIVYSIEMSGGLVAVDIASKKAVYRRWLDGYNRYNRFLYGVAASPTLAGKNIYITDDAGYTHILAPGPEFKEINKNVLENLHFGGSGGNPCKQESFYTSPFFEGKVMYLRGEDYLYCIEEK